MTKKALSASLTKSLLSAGQKIYQDIATMAETQSVEAVVSSLLPAQKYLSHASSVNLSAIDDHVLVDALLSEISLGTAGTEIRKMLGSHQVLCDVDQAWIRRQYAPHRYPPEHAPHGWHQDGALGFDFLASSGSKQKAEALLPTVTCWIALTHCGADAPGLEFVSSAVNELLLPHELTVNSINSRFTADSFWQPQMDPGDGVIFQGSTLHRTHVVNNMQTNRTSIELRFVAKQPIPPRLLGDCFVPLPEGRI
ncbi:phytanoyl-CoA dioxygenase family protein [uncultured Paraglaciecola sp.]|uniref:phytanoyl-CoA dioxygenase family protein n=1 Tax=uncultured Paraglaciecola sp. TaxID=1765024 RepID=UPI0030D8EF7E|tara:strand:+ start:21051 stop:21806 length:756 start_codon:yes stop_codon:yes gene_type:complete